MSTQLRGVLCKIGEAIDLIMLLSQITESVQ